jgi:DNA-binding Lrp family transcriptional regulator
LYAFILAKVHSGKDREVIQQIKKLKEVKMFYPTYGIYDLIMQIEYKEAKQLDSFVFDKVRSINGINETVTLICSEMLMWEFDL